MKIEIKKDSVLLDYRVWFNVGYLKTDAGEVIAKVVITPIAPGCNYSTELRAECTAAERALNALKLRGIAKVDVLHDLMEWLYRHPEAFSEKRREGREVDPLIQKRTRRHDLLFQKGRLKKHLENARKYNPALEWVGEAFFDGILLSRKAASPGGSGIIIGQTCPSGAYPCSTTVRILQQA